jgi:hypothetical protein
VVQAAGDEGERRHVGLEHWNVWQLLPPDIALLRAMRTGGGQEDDRGIKLIF